MGGSRHVLVITVAAVLAGCLGDVAPASTGDVAGGASAGLLATPVTVAANHDCLVHEVVVPVPMDEVQPLMPDGFEPMPSFLPDAGAPPHANFVFGPNDCRSFLVNGQDEGRLLFSFFVIPVEPPADLVDAMIDLHVVTVAMVTSNAAWADLARSWGATVIDGDASFTTLPAGPEAGLVTIDSDEVRATILGVAPAKDAEATRYVVRFWNVDGDAMFDAYLPGRHTAVGPAAATAEGFPFPVDSHGLAIYTNQPGLLAQLVPAGAPPPPDWLSDKS